MPESDPATAVLTALGHTDLTTPRDQACVRLVPGERVTVVVTATVGEVLDALHAGGWAVVPLSTLDVLEDMADHDYTDGSRSECQSGCRLCEWQRTPLSPDAQAAIWLARHPGVVVVQLPEPSAPGRYADLGTVRWASGLTVTDTGRMHLPGWGQLTTDQAERIALDLLAGVEQARQVETDAGLDQIQRLAATTTPAEAVSTDG